MKLIKSKLNKCKHDPASISTVDKLFINVDGFCDECCCEKVIMIDGEHYAVCPFCNEVVKHCPVKKNWKKSKATCKLCGDVEETYSAFMLAPYVNDFLKIQPHLCSQCIWMSMIPPKINSTGELKTNVGKYFMVLRKFCLGKIFKQDQFFDDWFDTYTLNGYEFYYSRLNGKYYHYSNWTNKMILRNHFLKRDMHDPGNYKHFQYEEEKDVKFLREMMPTNEKAPIDKVVIELLDLVRNGGGNPRNDPAEICYDENGKNH